MAADYSLHFDGLESATTEMRQISSQIESFLQELQSGTMKAILLWESGARDLFDHQRNLWANGAEDMTRQAQAAQAALNEIIQHYADGERTGVSIWNR
ncbi:WXG100 family type VII secretion target [Streptomyces sp. NPDC001617]